ncbi:MAG: hypothetical protein ABJI60_06095, partial [Kangiellaceae bacterium]
ALWVWVKIVRLRLRSAGLQGVQVFSKTKSTLSVVEVFALSVWLEIVRLRLRSAGLQGVQGFF